MAITNQYPTGNVELGLVQFGATITSDDYTGTFFLSPNFPSEAIWNPDIKLTITIADNASYTDADIYETDYVDSGEGTEAIQHAFVDLGTYYIKMETVDTEGGTNDLLEYTITVIRNLYFIEDPDVTIRAPICNKVIVRVKDSSPVVEASATTDPAPSADEVIERLVYIDDGDATVCQNIADELIVKWGKEQKNVSGVINLIVTLKFKEKVKIICPGANINEDLTLQQKEHNVIARKTRISCGDIMLDDSELLARILDELGV